MSSNFQTRIYLGGIFHRDIKVDDAVGSRKAAIARLAPVKIQTLGACERYTTISVAIADLQQAVTRRIVAIS